MQHHDAGAAYTAHHVFVVYTVWIGGALIAALVVLLLVLWLHERFPDLPWPVYLYTLILAGITLVDVQLGAVVAALIGIAMLCMGCAEFIAGSELEKRSRCCKDTGKPSSARPGRPCACFPVHPGGRGGDGEVRPAATARNQDPSLVTSTSSGDVTRQGAGLPEPEPAHSVTTDRSANAPNPSVGLLVTSARWYHAALVPGDEPISSPIVVPPQRDGINPFGSADAVHTVTVPAEVLHQAIA